MGKVSDINTRRPTGKSGNNGNGNGPLGERVSALEERTEHLATKADISNLKVWLLVGVLGGILTGIPAAISLIIIVLRFFPAG